MSYKTADRRERSIGPQRTREGDRGGARVKERDCHRPLAYRKRVLNMLSSDHTKTGISTHFRL